MNDSFNDFYTGTSNFEAYKLAIKIALNQFKNQNKPIVLFSPPGNGKNHLVQSLIKLCKTASNYEAINLITISNDKEGQLFTKNFKTGLVIFQHCQILKNNPETQKTINKFCESFNYELGNILLTTDTPIKEIFDFSLNFIDLEIYKPSYDLKEKMLTNKFQSHYLKSITEREVYEICSLDYENLRVFEGMIFLMFSNFELYQIPYSETICKIKKGNDKGINHFIITKSISNQCLNEVIYRAICWS